MNANFTADSSFTLRGESLAKRVIADWDAYSEPFLSVMPSKMLILNKTVAEYATGHVADYGCGAGKIIPFVLAQSQVKSYTGIDASAAMVKRARWVSSQFADKQSTILHSFIEQASLTRVDTAISINSYYAWDNPVMVLQHIRSQLDHGSTFILATINSTIDMQGLLEEAERELIAHPHWQEFKRHNLQIKASDDTNFISLDRLIGQVREVGFQVQEAHCRLYDGGLNFLVLSPAG